MGIFVPVAPSVPSPASLCALPSSSLGVLLVSRRDQAPLLLSLPMEELPDPELGPMVPDFSSSGTFIKKTKDSYDPVSLPPPSAQC